MSLPLVDGVSVLVEDVRWRDTQDVPRLDVDELPRPP